MATTATTGAGAATGGGLVSSSPAKPWEKGARPAADTLSAVAATRAGVQSAQSQPAGDLAGSAGLNSAFGSAAGSLGGAYGTGAGTLGGTGAYGSTYGAGAGAGAGAYGTGAYGAGGYGSGMYGGVGTMGSYGGGYGSSMYGGGYGSSMYGGGYGGLGGGYGMSRFGYGGGTMGGAGGGLVDPSQFGWLASINQIVGSIGQITEMLGMNADALNFCIGSFVHFVERIGAMCAGMAAMVTPRPQFPPGHPRHGEPPPTEEEERSRLRRVRVFQFMVTMAALAVLYKGARWLARLRGAGRRALVAPPAPRVHRDLESIFEHTVGRRM